MPRMLVTGGTVFVSRAVAEYYVAKGFDVFVLNRNTKAQPHGVTLIEADRHCLGDILREYEFDIVIDTAYTAQDVNMLLDALSGQPEYIFISSSAVYPEYAAQPFHEETPSAPNKYWKKYGTDKIEAETALVHRRPDAYILRPPYLYGPMNNVYREAFVFDCAMVDQKFFLPRDGSMKLQFFHVHDLCRFTDILLQRKPQQHIFNVGNGEAVSIREWVELCYAAVGKKPAFEYVYKPIEQRHYFPFYDYEYILDVSGQYAWMPDVKPLQIGLQEALAWYVAHADQVNKKPLLNYIDEHFAT